MESKICPQCKTESANDASICSNCFFPFNGTDKEKGVFIAQQIRNKSKVKDAAHGIKTAQIALIIISFFNGIAIVFLQNQIEIMAQFVFFILLVIATLLVTKKPVLVLSIVLSFFGLLYILMLLFDRNLFIQGLFWKVATIISLGYGLNSVLAARKAEQISPYLAEQSTEKRIPKKRDDILD